MQLMVILVYCAENEHIDFNSQLEFRILETD